MRACRFQFIVGYSNSALRPGAKMVAPCFLSVGATDEVSLNDLSPNGYTAGELDVDVRVCVLNGSGVTIQDYYWYDNEDFSAGWYTEEGDPVDPTKVKFEAGQGLWVYGGTGINVTTSGQVNEQDVVVPLRAGGTPTGNMMATKVKLSQIIVGGYTAGELDVDVRICILNGSGVTVQDYYWYDNEDFSAGWYTEEGDPIDASKVEFEPGDGLWVYGASGITLRFPAPELN